MSCSLRPVAGANAIDDLRGTVQFCNLFTVPSQTFRGAEINGGYPKSSPT
jgi:hypothetical protein